MASGILQVLAYKHDIEAALRTEGFGGYQLLDLHDFPGQGTALVGVLEAFWDAKGYISAEEFRRFSGPIVPLVRMSKMVYTTSETLDAELELSHFGPADFEALVSQWKLVDQEGRTLASGQLPSPGLEAYRLHNLGKISVPLGGVSAPVKLKLVVTAEGENFSNDWDVFVYPEADAVESPSIVSDLEKALSLLGQGKSVLWTPPASSVANDKKRPLIMGFSLIFWNTAWANWQPPHTLGVLVDPQQK